MQNNTSLIFRKNLRIFDNITELADHGDERGKSVLLYEAHCMLKIQEWIQITRIRKLNLNSAVEGV